MKQIVPGLHTFDGLMVGRVYLIEDADGLTIIDAGLELAGKRILRQIEAMGRKPGDVKRILITHAHPDHIGALPLLKAQTGAQLCVSALENEVIEGKIPIKRPDPAMLPPIWRLMPMSETTLKPIPIDHVMQDGEVLENVMGGLRVVSTPGHAPGHVSFWQPEQRILICGDVLMNLFGGLRLPFAAFTADMDEDRRSIQKVAALDPAVVCFGHGAPLTVNAAQRLREFAAKVAPGSTA